MSITTNVYLDKKQEMLLEAAQDALNQCEKEGISVLEIKNDEELIAWYERAMDFETYEPSEDEGRPF